MTDEAKPNIGSAPLSDEELAELAKDEWAHHISPRNQLRLVRDLRAARALLRDLRADISLFVEDGRTLEAVAAFLGGAYRPTGGEK